MIGQSAYLGEYVQQNDEVDAIPQIDEKIFDAATGFLKVLERRIDKELMEGRLSKGMMGRQRLNG